MASLAAIQRQVNREGKRWGLVGIIRDGAVKVCETVNEVLPRKQGCITVPEKTPRVVCSLDENSSFDAFAQVLAHRLKREHHDFMKLVNNRKARLRREAQAELDLRRSDLRRKLQHIANARVISSGIMR